MSLTVESLKVELGADIGKYERGMKQALSTFERTANGMEKQMAGLHARIGAGMGKIPGLLRGGIGGLAGGLGVGGLVAGLGIGELVETVRNAAAELAKIGDVSDRIGVTTDALQELRYASEQTGGSAETADAGLTKFAANLADASAKGGDLYKVLTANNIAFTDASGRLLPVTDVLARYADLMTRAKSPAEALELSIRAFGRAAGPELVGLLGQGSGAIAALQRQAREGGAVMDRELIEKARVLDDKFAQVGTRIRVAVQGAIVGAAGALRDFVLALNDAIKVSAEAPAVAARQLAGEAAGIRAQIEEQRKTSNFAVIGDLEKRLADAEKRAAVLNEQARENNRAVGLGRAGGSATMPVQGPPIPADLPDAVLPPSGGGGGSKKSSAQRALDDYKALRDRAAERVRDLEVEASSYGLTEAAAESLRFQKQLLADVDREGIKLTQDQERELARLVDRYGSLVTAAQAAREAQEAAADAARTGADVTKGLVSDLKAGTSFADALSNAFGRLGDKLTDNLIDSLFSTGTNGAGAGPLGALFNAAASSFAGGFARGGTVPAGKWGIVGEDGPELIGKASYARTVLPNLSAMVPTTAPKLTAAGRSGPSSMNVRVNVDVSGARGDKDIEARVLAAASVGMRQAIEANNRQRDRTIQARYEDAGRRGYVAGRILQR